MDWNFKKMCLGAAFSLVAVTQLLNALVDPYGDIDARLTALEMRRGRLNPSASPGVREGSDVFITGAALYWKPNADGLEYAIDNAKGESLAFADDGKIKHTRGKWSWGWEVGIGYNMGHDNWDIYLNWTHFNGRSHSNSEDEDGCCSHCCPEFCSGTLFPIWVNWQTPEVPTCMFTCDVNTHWKMRLDMVDLELGRDFFVSKYLCMRPFAGLRWLNIKNKHVVDYTGYFSVTPQIPTNIDVISTLLSTDADIDLNAHFWGVGPRAGVTTLWNFERGWGLFGNTALSLLYGQSKSKYEMDLETPSVFNRGEVKNQPHLTRAVIDLALGLEWDYQFKNDLFHLGFALGWEHHLFFGMSQFIRFLDNQEQGSLTTYQGNMATQGFTLTGRFDF